MGKLFNGILSVSLVLMMLSSCGERNEVRRVLSSFMETEIELPHIASERVGAPVLGCRRGPL